MKNSHSHTRNKNYKIYIMKKYSDFLMFTASKQQNKQKNIFTYLFIYTEFL